MLANNGVSMKSGLEDRNNNWKPISSMRTIEVSMKSGLEDRNNPNWEHCRPTNQRVSMKSGLEDRNNRAEALRTAALTGTSQ